MKKIFILLLILASCKPLQIAIVDQPQNQSRAIGWQTIRSKQEFKDSTQFDKVSRFKDGVKVGNDISGSHTVVLDSVTTDGTNIYFYKEATILTAVPGTGSAAWGAITGNIASQSDLTSALNAKSDLSTTMTTSHAANAITGANITNWNSAYGWGNHASVGYALNSSLANYALSSALSSYVPTTRTVNGHPLSGNVSITTTDLSLNNVDNTSDLNKPISTATGTALSGKQATLVNGVNFSTVGGQSLLTGTDIPIAGSGTVTSVAVTTANGVSASVANSTTAANATFSLGAITPSSVAAVGTVTGSNLSGTNTGDNATNSQYSGLVTNATHTGDATGSGALTVVKINGTLLSGLSTGLLKITNGTGVPSIASPGTDYVVPSGSITGNAATATKLAATKTINGIAFDGSANITVPSNITPGTSGNVLTSNGSVFTSAAPAAPASHTHGNITNAGAIGSTATLPIITTTGGALTVGSFGTSAGTFAQGNDNRFGTGSTDTLHLASDLASIQPDYVIEKISTTYYARPGRNTAYTAYSGATFSTIVNSTLAAISTGGKIYIKPGTYTVTTPITIINYSNIKLEGAGNDLTVFTSAGVGTTYNIIDINGTCNNIEISGIKFVSTANSAADEEEGLINVDWFTATPIIDGLNIHHCTFTAPTIGVNGVYISVGYANAYLKRFYFTNNYMYSIGQCGLAFIANEDYHEGAFYRMQDVSVTDNVFKDCGTTDRWGMSITNSGMTKNLSIQRNYIYNQRKDQAIEVRCSYLADISFNKIFNDTYVNAGITVNGGGSGEYAQRSSHVTITGNEIYLTYIGDGYCPIRADNTDYLTITGNTVTGQDVRIDSCDYVTITGNTIKQQDYWGILLQNGTQYAIISNNIIDQTHHTGNAPQAAVNISGAASMYNIVKDNTILYHGGRDVSILRQTSSANNNVLETKDHLDIWAAPSDNGDYFQTFLDGDNFTVVTSATGATDFSYLPIACTAMIGKRVRGMVGASGFEMRTDATQAATVYINGVTTNVEAAIPANSTFEVTCVDATHWILKAWTSTGDVLVIVPDAI